MMHKGQLFSWLFIRPGTFTSEKRDIRSLDINLPKTMTYISSTANKHQDFLEFL